MFEISANYILNEMHTTSPTGRVSLFDYNILPERFEGSGGTIVKVESKRDKSIYALKMIKKSRKMSEYRIQRLKEEVEIMRKINHKNVIKVHQIWEDENAIYIVSDWANEGNLFDLLDIEERLCEEETARILYQTVQALQYLHSQSPPIVHRDLKPENILLTEGKQVRLADFGWATHVTSSRSSLAGTPMYVAPEMVSSTPYDYRVDIWSIGVVLFELLTGDLPFFDEDEDQMYDQISRKEVTFPSHRHLSSEAKDLISRTLQKSPDNRPTLEEIREHPLFQKYGLPAEFD